jgi:hypothetical protein
VNGLLRDNSVMMRLALYSHDAQGLGHVRRNLSMAAGVVGSHDGSAPLIGGLRGVPELLAHERDPPSLAAALGRMLDDAALRVRLARASAP